MTDAVDTMNHSEEQDTSFEKKCQVVHSFFLDDILC